MERPSVELHYTSFWKGQVQFAKRNKTRRRYITKYNIAEGKKTENPLLPGVTKLISMLFLGDINWAKLLVLLK